MPTKQSSLDRLFGWLSSLTSDRMHGSPLDRFVAWLGFPAWAPLAATWALGIYAFAMQMYITSNDSDLVSFGAKSLNVDSTGTQVLIWSPVVAFCALCLLCMFRKAYTTLLALAGGLAVFGMTHGSLMLYTPSHRWAWGVALALACVLAAALWRIYRTIIAVIVIALVAILFGLFLLGLFVYDEIAHRLKQQSTKSPHSGAALG